MVRTRVENPEGGRRTIKWSILAPWLLIAALICANVASILNATVHALGFRLLESVLTSVGGSAAASILNASPTKVATRERSVIAKASTAAKSVAKRTTIKFATRAAGAVASLPAKMAPFAGAAVIVAMTANDIRSDCATVKDMNEILDALHLPPEDPGVICVYANKVPSVKGRTKGSTERP